MFGIIERLRLKKFVYQLFYFLDDDGIKTTVRTNKIKDLPSYEIICRNENYADKSMRKHIQETYPKIGKFIYFLKNIE